MTRSNIVALKCGCCKRIILTARDGELTCNASIFCEDCWPHLQVMAEDPCPVRQEAAS